MTPRRRVDWIGKLRHLLQVLAFTLAVATIQVAFMPDKPYGPPVVYSVLIGLFTWIVIDLGQELIPSAAETGWPQGWQGLALVATGIAVGYVVGTWLAGLLCAHYFHFYPAGSVASAADQRTAILITVLAGLAGTYYFYTVNKSAYLEGKMAEARMHASEARLKLLETQLEPHMLFNTLANLRALIATDPARAQHMLDRLIAYLRATLGGSRRIEHPLADEFARLADYLELMAVRMGPRLAYALELPEALHGALVPPLLLQPLVENAIRHGLEPLVAGGRIDVQARLLPGGTRVQLCVHDTGAGLGGMHAMGGTRFGLPQVRERLATLYGAAGTLELIADSAGGASAIVTFPLKTEPHDTSPGPDRRG